MLYGPLWRVLPGPRLAKIGQLVVLAFLVVAVCFLWVFPAIAPHMPFNDNTVDGSAPAAPPASTSTPSGTPSAPSATPSGTPSSTPSATSSAAPSATSIPTPSPS